MSEPAEYGPWVSELGNSYRYRIEATTSPLCWWLKVTMADKPPEGRPPSFALAFGEFGGWHVYGPISRAHRKATRFIEKQLLKDQRQAAINLKGSESHG